MALWIPPFTGTKESVMPMLQQLADRGLLALSLDPFQHGERGTEGRAELIARVFEPGAFRRALWPVLGQTTIDARRVLDWVSSRYDVISMVVGGHSMGGDIAVALAGLDERISKVAATVATPDWRRPGMRSFAPPYDIVDQGTADDYAQWFFDQFDPLTHLERYDRDCAIAFECASEDAHVPPDGALRFQAALKGTQARIRVNLHEGFGHGDGMQTVFAENCIDWLTT